MCLLYPTQSTCWNIVNLYWKNRCCCLRLLEIKMDLFQSYINLCCFSFIAIYSHYFNGQFLRRSANHFYTMVKSACAPHTQHSSYNLLPLHKVIFSKTALWNTVNLFICLKPTFCSMCNYKMLWHFQCIPESSKSFRRGMTWQKLTSFNRMAFR